MSLLLPLAFYPPVSTAWLLCPRLTSFPAVFITLDSVVAVYLILGGVVGMADLLGNIVNYLPCASWHSVPVSHSLVANQSP